MSAYVVADSTINKVVSLLYLKTAGSESRYYVWNGLEKLGYNLQTKEGQKQLAQDMFDLNCDAVNQRYGEGQAEEFRPLDFEYCFTLQVNPFSALKALECWRYQCSEGNVPDHPLYKVMLDWERQICRAIVHNLPQYEAAPYGR